MQGRVAWALVMLFAVMMAYANALTLLDPSRDRYPTTPDMDVATYQELWGFNWSEGLNLTLAGSGSLEWNGSTIRVEHYTYTLGPRWPGCLEHAWLYRLPTTQPGAAWVVLVHGLGGSHRDFEESHSGLPPLALELASQGLNVLAIDAAGHGESCIPGGSTWEDLARDIRPGRFFLYHVYLSAARAVEAALQLGAQPGRIAVAGVSLGGMTSIVVGSIHPSVSLAVPVVAAGCLTCMIASGGLANLVGSPNMTLNPQAALALAASDPLSYARMAAFKGWLRGKEFYILYSGHDEYFPLESLYPTLGALESGGARVVVDYAGNNDHYKPAPGWHDSLVSVLASWAHGGDPLEGLPQASLANLGTLLAGGRGAWRPAFDGAAYLPLVPVLPALMGGEAYTTTEGAPVASSIPRAEPWWLRALLLVAGVALAVYAGGRLGLSWRWAPLAAALASALAFAAPFWWWPGRFTLSILGFMERYAVTPSLVTGVPSLGLAAASLAGAPLAASLLAMLPRDVSRRWRVALVAVYLVLALLPYILGRLVVSAIASRAPWPLPAHVVPAEAAHLVVAAAAWLLSSRAPVREEVEGWRLAG